MNTFLKIIGWGLIVFGIAIMFTLRIIGGDLAEGRLLVQYAPHAPYWILAAGLLLGGIVIISNTENRVCNKCGHRLKRRWGWFGKAIGCTKPLCDDFYLCPPNPVPPPPPAPWSKF